MKVARALLIPLCFLFIACPSHPSKPLTITKSSQARPYIKDAHLTRSLLFDGGKLKLDPFSGKPLLAEARALSLWESAAPFGQPAPTRDAVVFLANATLRVPVAGGIDRPIGIRFDRRPTWVFVWKLDQVCIFSPGPNMSIPPLPPAADSAVELIPADASTEGVLYHPTGFECGRGRQPVNYAEVATYHLSVPWTISDRHGIRGVVHATVPACAYATGSSGVFGGLAAIDVAVRMLPGPCPNVEPRQAELAYNVQIFSPPIHAPTGLVLSRATSRFTLLYYDGQPHSVSLGCYANPGRGGNPPLKC